MQGKQGFVELVHAILTGFVKAWIQAPLAAKALYGNLHLLNTLMEYKLINEDISSSTTIDSWLFVAPIRKTEWSCFLR